MVNTCEVKAYHRHDFRPLVNHMTKLQEFLAFSFQLMFDQTSNNLIVCLMFFAKTTYTSTNEISYCSAHWVGSIFGKMYLK